jgi:hypothetical protein
MEMEEQQGRLWKSFPPSDLRKISLFRVFSVLPSSFLRLRDIKNILSFLSQDESDVETKANGAREPKVGSMALPGGVVAPWPHLFS